MAFDCTFCGVPGHQIHDCPEAKRFIIVREHGVFDAMHDEPDVSLVDRLHRLRAFTRGLLCDLRRAGVELSPETKALTPPLDNLE